MLLNWSIAEITDAEEVCLECRLVSPGSWLGDGGGWMPLAGNLRCRLAEHTRELIRLSKELGLPELTEATLPAWRRRLFAWDAELAERLDGPVLVRHLGLRTDAPALSEAAFFRRCLETDRPLRLPADPSRPNPDEPNSGEPDPDEPTATPPADRLDLSPLSAALLDRLGPAQPETTPPSRQPAPAHPRRHPRVHRHGTAETPSPASPTETQHSSPPPLHRSA